MKYLKLHYIDFFNNLGQQIANNYPNSEDPFFKNYNLFQFGKSLITYSEETYLLLFKFDFTKGPLRNGYNKFEYLKINKDTLSSYISKFVDNGWKEYKFNNIYLMEDLSAKTEYYTLEFREEN